MSYRFEPFEIKLPRQTLTVEESTCLCGSCDTVTITTKDDRDGEVEIYNVEHPNKTTLEYYEQVQNLKDIIIELAKIIKEKA